MSLDKQKLSIDLKSLFPGDTINIGDQTFFIEPLNIKQLATITTQLKGMVGLLVEQGVTIENYGTPDNILKISTILLTQFPDVLEEATNIEKESLYRLPIELIIEILNKVIDVNLKSKGDLEKNFNSLTEKLDFLTGQNPTPNQSKKTKK